jgi:hypothetical protein
LIVTVSASALAGNTTRVIMAPIKINLRKWVISSSFLIIKVKVAIDDYIRIEILPQQKEK